MKTKIAWSISGVVFLVLLPCLVSAEIEVTLKLDREEASLNDAIHMVISISFGPRSSDSRPILDFAVSDYHGGTDRFLASDLQPVLTGLESFGITREDTSTDLGIDQGDLKARVDYTYLIYPKEVGTFQVGPAEVAVEGQTFQSNTTTLTVVERSRAPDADQKGLVFLKAELSAPRVYLGDQLVYVLRLYRNARVSDIDLDLPKTEYLAFRQLGNQAEYEKVVDGQEYTVLEVRCALASSKAGKLAIQPARMRMKVYPPGQADRGAFVDSPIYALTSGLDMAVESQSLELDVVPLPEEQKPADFSGLVGHFQIDAQLEPSTIKAGESAILTVFLRGRGNIDRIPDMMLPQVAQTEVYPDQTVLEFEPDEQGLKAVKTMKWALVPKEAGQYEIPSLAISFFDTGTHQYQVAQTAALRLSVVPGEEGQASGSGREEEADGGALKHVVRELGWDILPVRTSVEDPAGGFRVRPGGLFSWGILLFPFCVYLGAAWSLKSRHKSASALAAMRAKKAAKNLTRKCHHAALTSNDATLAIRDYLNDRFGHSIGTVTPEEAAEIVRSHGADMETAEELRHLVKNLEDAVYTGKGNETCERVEDISGLVRQIEKEVH